jgi:hypothetical protein
MKRKIYEKLIDWKSTFPRKPLILKGARQTGKTYILREFGNREFLHLHYINFQKDKKAHSLFNASLSPEKVIESLEFFLNTKIEIKNDLLFFDEIQDCPAALTSLKFFCEEMPDLALVCAGSLLGVVHSAEPFPVGKTAFLNIHPLSFEEFLLAAEDEKGITALYQAEKGQKPSAIAHDYLMEKVKEYMAVGGMPEVVKTFLQYAGEGKITAFGKMREKQQELITAYTGDFSKYAGHTRANEIAAVFESVPSQLAKENKKFKASEVISGGRFSRLQSAVDWLVNAGLVLKTDIINSGELPFSAFTQNNRYKLYLFDIGLLGALAELPFQAVLTASDTFATFKGAFCENYVAQEFICAGTVSLYAWASNTAEVEFVKEKNGMIFPVEVKSGLSGKLKSLNVFAEKYSCVYRTRISARNLEYNRSAKFCNLPLYLCHAFPQDFTENTIPG